MTEMNNKTSNQNMKQPKLILLRHGESMWNRSSQHPTKVWRYAGSIDVPLSKAGVLEAVEAGERLKSLPVDFVFTSNLNRALMTALLAMNNHGSGLTPIHCTRDGSLNSAKTVLHQYTDHQSPEPDTPVFIPIISTDILNERNFGDLQGVASTEHANRFSPKDLTRYRNDYRTPFPNGESSKDVYDRVIPYFIKTVIPVLKSGKNVAMVSHGFVMRVLIQYIENMSETEFNQNMSIEKSNPEKCKLATPTGIPQVYQFDGESGHFREISCDEN